MSFSLAAWSCGGGWAAVLFTQGKPFFISHIPYATHIPGPRSISPSRGGLSSSPGIDSSSCSHRIMVTNKAILHEVLTTSDASSEVTSNWDELVKLSKMDLRERPRDSTSLILILIVDAFEKFEANFSQISFQSSLFIKFADIKVLLFHYL